MKKRREMRRRKNGCPNSLPPPPPRTLQTLIHAFRNSKGLKRQLLLKRLYTFLIKFSSCCPVGPSSKLLSASSMDFPDLCDTLFRELDKMFQQLFSALFNVSSVSASQQSRMLSSLCATSEEFTLLLRCCLVILTLPQLDQSLALDKGDFLLSVFVRLCSLDVIGVDSNEEIKFRKSLSQKSVTIDGLTSSVAEDFVASLCFLKPSHSCLPLLCALLEVFVDEFLVHKSLRENLVLLDCLSSRDVLFANHSRHEDIRNVMELIASHFILSFSNDQVCDSLLNRLSWHHRMDTRVSQLSMNQCALLLLDSTFLSAPEFVQAHLILMASEAVGIDFSCTSAAPDVRSINFYLLAFERSVILYSRHIYALHLDRDSSSVSCPDLCGTSLHPSFDFFVRPTTRCHLDRLLSKLDDNWLSWTKNATLRTKEELVSTSFAYLEENQGIFPDLNGKMLSYIQELILVASQEVTDSTSFEKVHASLPHMLLTASLLKSMNVSLLQALRCLEISGKVGNMKLVKDFSESKEHGFIVRVISCFQKLNNCLPMPRHPLICDLLRGSKTKHPESKQMLLHFSCFLSLGFRYKLEFLVKGCIFTLMTLLTLIIFEDGHMDAVDLLFVYLSGASVDSLNGKPDENKAQEQSIRKSSRLVASKFQKIQTLFSSQSSTSSSTHIMENWTDEASSMHMEEETCSGKMYLNCLFENSKTDADVDDLSDFIECKPGKDYSEWLKEREKYRKWKVQKMAVLRWEKRKKTWHSIKGSKS